MRYVNKRTAAAVDAASQTAAVVRHRRPIWRGGGGGRANNFRERTNNKALRRRGCRRAVSAFFHRSVRSSFFFSFPPLSSRYALGYSASRTTTRCRVREELVAFARKYNAAPRKSNRMPNFSAESACICREVKSERQIARCVMKIVWRKIIIHGQGGHERRAACARSCRNLEC